MSLRASCCFSCFTATDWMLRHSALYTCQITHTYLKPNAVEDLAFYTQLPDPALQDSSADVTLAAWPSIGETFLAFIHKNYHVDKQCNDARCLMAGAGADLAKAARANLPVAAVRVLGNGDVLGLDLPRG